MANGHPFFLSDGVIYIGTKRQQKCIDEFFSFYHTEDIRYSTSFSKKRCIGDNVPKYGFYKTTNYFFATADFHKFTITSYNVHYVN